jgi:valyl-tRNA synthetase
VADGICKADAESYTIVLPPPNITDKLHLGHVVMTAISDILIRFERMRGKKALWIPGTDHAAIATQNVVEKKLLKEEGKTRHDLGKEKFLERVWEFVDETQSTIIRQLKSTGASLDWSREAFTLDEKRQKAVKQMFVDMYKEGIIYRGHRIVNWCPRCRSTLADDEVEYKEQTAKFYTFKYSPDFPITISTTRPETKLGDTAVAVHPDDKRYQEYIGKEFKINFLGIPLKLKIVADEGINPEFGTGALGVTPAHSMVDFEMAQTKGLDVKKVIDEEGKIVAGLGEFSSQPVSQARQMVVERLREQGLLELEEDIANNLSLCYRCDTPIEPLTSRQWFVSVDKPVEHLDGQSLKQKAIQAAKNGDIEFIPERFHKQYLQWMENLHDWCISRQIWFGHQIPAWYKQLETRNSQLITQDEDTDIFVGMEAPEGEGWVQDEDVLDTWFSSGMWTFSTLGWPEETLDLKTYHPTQLLETGYEIITLWVSRMIMMSFFAMGEIPFSQVYLHGMVLDAQGQKMSKSKGNGIDPLEMFGQYGADATRIALIIGNTPGNNIRMSEEKIAASRNTVNKLWNIARFVLGELEDDEAATGIKQETCSESELWILGKLKNLISQVSQDIENCRFSQAGENLREFTWNDFADWYLEASKFEKTENRPAILYNVLFDLLKLWHPFIPFVTESIWQEWDQNNLLMAAAWPQADKYSHIPEKNNFSLTKEIISAIRSIRADYQIEPKQKVKAVIYSEHQNSLEAQAKLLKGLRTGIGELKIAQEGEPLPRAAFQAVNGAVIYIPLEGVIDLDKEIKRIQNRIAELDKLIVSAEKKLSNKQFTQNAPAEVIAKEKEKSKAYQEEKQKLEKQLENLS